MLIIFDEWVIAARTIQKMKNEANLAAISANVIVSRRRFACWVPSAHFLQYPLKVRVE
jgi:hypothetical protein